MLYRRTTDVLQAYYRRTTDVLQTHYRRTTDVLQTHPSVLHSRSVMKFTLKHFTTIVVNPEMFKEVNFVVAFFDLWNRNISYPCNHGSLLYKLQSYRVHVQCLPASLACKYRPSAMVHTRSTSVVLKHYIMQLKNTMMLITISERNPATVVTLGNVFYIGLQEDRKIVLCVISL